MKSFHEIDGRPLLNTVAEDVELYDGGGIDVDPIMPMTVGGFAATGLICAAFGMSVHRQPGGQTFIAIAMKPRNSEHALFQPFTSAVARSFAAALIRTADLLDAGKGVQ